MLWTKLTIRNTHENTDDWVKERNALNAMALDMVEDIDTEVWYSLEYENVNKYQKHGVKKWTYTLLIPYLSEYKYELLVSLDYEVERMRAPRGYRRKYYQKLNNGLDSSKSGVAGE